MNRRVHWLLPMLTLVVVALVLSPAEALAQPELPELDIDGVDTEEDNPMTLMFAIFKVVLKGILWAGVAFLAGKVVFEAIKDIRDARDGDTKWVAAGKSIASGVLFFVVALALTLWINGTLLS